jgi:hypothetical protein
VVVPGFHNHVMKAVVGAIPETWILNMSAKSAAKPEKKAKRPAPAPAPEAAAAVPAQETVLAVPASRRVEEKRAAA